VPWFVIAALVAVNALYVAAEFSAVAVQRAQIATLAEGGHRRAKQLLQILENGGQLDRYIAACQIGITLSSLVAGAYGQATLGADLAPVLARALDWSPEAAVSASAIIVLLGLTTLQVVIGELVPKSLALQFPERTSLLTVLPTQLSARLFRGFIWLLNGSGFLLLRPFGVKPGGHQHVHSPEEIGILIAESTHSGAVSPQMSERLQRGLRLSQRTVRDVMIPRDQIYAIDRSSPPEEVLSRVIASPYSRIVVHDKSLDHVVGSVGIKDIVGHYAMHGTLPVLADIMRPMVTVQHTVRADQLVRRLQEQNRSKAIVVGEDGLVVGIVSIDDVLSDVFGEETP
jgi:putative hemolysin